MQPNHILRLASMAIVGLVGIGLIVYALAFLAIGSYSAIESDTINLLHPLAKLTTLPLSFTTLILFISKAIFMMLLGLGLVSAGLYIALFSDIMYVAALLFTFVGVAGMVLVEMLAKWLLSATL